MPGTAGMFVTLCFGSDSLCQTNKFGSVVNLILVDALPLLDADGLSSEGKKLLLSVSSTLPGRSTEVQCRGWIRHEISCPTRFC